MPDRWWNTQTWDDTSSSPSRSREQGSTNADTAVTHRCRVCNHGAAISTPQRRTEHFCRDCETWRRFESVVDDAA